MSISTDHDVWLENIAAEFTSAAYPVVLQQRPKAPWFQLELGLWRALAEAVQDWDRRPRPDAEARHAWREDFLIDLTRRASFVACRNGVCEPRLEIESGLALAFGQVMRRYGHVS
jgi:hypothetical protein